jgi:hypothetical protein
MEKPFKAEAAAAPIPASEPEMEVKSASTGIDIPVPQGFEAPEDSEEGRSFDVLATVSFEGGKLTLTAIDGLPVSAKAEAEAEEDVAEEADMEEDGDFMAAVERGLAKEV